MIFTQHSKNGYLNSNIEIHKFSISLTTTILVINLNSNIEIHKSYHKQ